jgi:hypothetical protein
MGQVKCGKRLSESAIVGLAALAALAPAAWGYINGGDYHNTFANFTRDLKAQGWGVGFGAPMSGDAPRGVGGTAFVPPDKPEHERYINQLVGHALVNLPEMGADRVPAEAKREVARLTREAIQEAHKTRGQSIKKGQTGSLQYSVGAFAFHAYWETNYGNKRKLHEQRSGLIPFVALRLARAEDQPKQP